MELSPLDPPPVQEPVETSPVGILLSRDLIFTSKVVGTANELDYRVLVAGNVSLALSLIERWKPRVVFVDLTAGDLAAPPALHTLQEAAGPNTSFVAFGPHVETELLAAAQRAGCQAVLPRSKFSAQLAELIRFYFHEDRSNRERDLP